MMGSVLMAFLGGMYYWWPKITGKMFSDRWGKVACIVIVVGFNVTFFPQFVAGSRGMPRRYGSYPAKFQHFHVISTFGAYTMGLGLVLVALNWAHSLARGKKAPANPWGGNTLEWHTPSPPPHDNFKIQPVVSDPYHLDDWKYDAAIEGWVLVPNLNPSTGSGH
jgi:cytochrome c oxidase subunit 1